MTPATAQAKPAVAPARAAVAPPAVYSPHRSSPRPASVQAKARYLAPPPVRFPAVAGAVQAHPAPAARSVPPPAIPPPPVRFHEQTRSVQAKPAGVAPPPLRFPGQSDSPGPSPAAQPKRLHGLRRRLASVGHSARPKAKGSQGRCSCSHHGCNCGHRAEVQARWSPPGPSIQRKVIQKAESDSDYMDDSDEETDCDDTDYADPDDDCEVYPQYNIRDTFYPSNYRAATLLWKTGRMTALQGTCPGGQFRCPGGCNACINNANGTIDHVVPVVTHWNNTGRFRTQADRANWYNDTNNMEVVCGPCNSSMGGGGAVYNRQVGAGFAGPGEG